MDPESSTPIGHDEGLSVILCFLHRRLMTAAAVIAASVFPLQAQKRSPVWDPDLGDGRYKNPIVHADYSDPDVIRVGADFYLVASSFDSIPGLPILHSRDLVHWEIVAHALERQPPFERYSRPQPGNGVWAPAIRYHTGQFFIFYPDPDIGIYMVRAQAVTGPWSEPLLVKQAKGWIDPCPFWDDDGSAWLVNGLAGSRAGAKSALLLNRMAPDGTRVLDGATLIIEGHPQDPTLEGPKLYKHDGYYYVSAPAGGVTTGWQLVYRSRTITGPYERRVVLAQGSTPTNGPHQGAWVDTPSGEWWFLHFQDKGAYGRILHLEPMTWGPDDWPRIGIHMDAAGTSEPVLTYRKPRIAGPTPTYLPATSDEFNGPTLGLQWQWQANPGPTWAFPSPVLGALRLISVPFASPPDNQEPLSTSVDLRLVPNVLSQKFPAEEFDATVKLKFTSLRVGERVGLVILGNSFSTLVVENMGQDRFELRQETSLGNGQKPLVSAPVAISVQSAFFLRAGVRKGAKVQFSYSTNGTDFLPLGTAFRATQGGWVGAKVGLYALGMPSDSPRGTGEYGYADVDWFRVTQPE